MDRNAILKAIAGTVAGILLGWTGNALSLGGRVAAIEQSLIRIETRLDNAAKAKP